MRVGSLVVLCALVGCGSARRGEPVAGPLALSEEGRRGQIVFMVHCEQCHPGGEAGLGPALTNTPPPVWLQRQQVRLGAGSMPAFGRDELAPDDLDALADYLRALRRHRPDRERLVAPSNAQR
jgi:mono/diheme cytochrome c family protein